MLLSIAKNESQMNLLWTAGLTPFSYLSSSQEMSFALREAALRGWYRKILGPIYGSTLLVICCSSYIWRCGQELENRTRSSRSLSGMEIEMHVTSAKPICITQGVHYTILLLYDLTSIS